MRIAWIDDSVAFGPAPTRSEVEELAKQFRAIVTLIEEHEYLRLGYDPSYLANLGLEILWIPTTDFRAPTSYASLKALDFVEKAVQRGEKVYIHCFAGLGRSATVAAHYLVAKHGLDHASAISRVRSLRRGAVESSEQVRSIERFYHITSLARVWGWRKLYELLREVDPSEDRVRLGEVLLDVGLGLRTELGIQYYDLLPLYVAPILEESSRDVDVCRYLGPRVEAIAKWLAGRGSEPPMLSPKELQVFEGLKKILEILEEIDGGRASLSYATPYRKRGSLVDINVYCFSECNCVEKEVVVGSVTARIRVRTAL